VNHGELADRWKQVSTEIRAHQQRIAVLAAERQEITRQLYAAPGATLRTLGAELGVSSVTIYHILHLGEVKPGRNIREGGVP